LKKKIAKNFKIKILKSVPHFFAYRHTDAKFCENQTKKCGRGSDLKKV